MVAKVVSMPSSTFMSTAVSGNIDRFSGYIANYNQPLMQTDVGRRMVENSQQVFSHVFGREVIQKAKDEFTKSNSSQVSTQIYNMLPGTYESANDIMKDMVMYNPDMHRLFIDDSINAFNGYEYKVNPIDIENIQYDILGNYGSSDDMHDEVYITESSDPDDYQQFSTIEKTTIQDLWNQVSTMILEDDVDPVTGESI